MAQFNFEEIASCMCLDEIGSWRIGLVSMHYLLTGQQYLLGYHLDGQVYRQPYRSLGNTTTLRPNLGKN